MPIINFFYPRWGSEYLSWDDISLLDYLGVRWYRSLSAGKPCEKPQMLAALEKTGLKYSLLH